MGRRGVSLFAGPREPSTTWRDGSTTTPTLEPVTGLADDLNWTAEPVWVTHDRRATVCSDPADTAAQWVPVPTLPGDNRSVVVPSPSSPLPLAPHAHRVPSVLTATVCQYPADT